MPGGLHHLKHHVVLDVLYEVEHALSEGERSSKPAYRQFEQSVRTSGWFFINSLQVLNQLTIWENVRSTA